MTKVHVRVFFRHYEINYISNKNIKDFAESKFDKFRTIQAKNYESDFDKLLVQVREWEDGYKMG